MTEQPKSPPQPAVSVEQLERVKALIHIVDVTGSGRLYKRDAEDSRGLVASFAAEPKETCSCFGGTGFQFSTYYDRDGIEHCDICGRACAAPPADGVLHAKLCRLIKDKAPRRDPFTYIPIGTQVEELADAILALQAPTAPIREVGAWQALKLIATTQRECFPSAAEHGAWCVETAFAALVEQGVGR